MLRAENIRIERIVSKGDTLPKKDWRDQEELTGWWAVHYSLEDIHQDGMDSIILQFILKVIKNLE